jgi:UDP-N-acetylmuramyl pentapeptide phosphotransferase/UDP-N-acetylglucosamine-1-phosphate transferase
MTWLMAISGIVFLSALAITFVLILLLMPLLRRYATARPNARSSHKIPTPQGGGIAIVAAMLTGIGVSVVLFPTLVADSARLTIVLASVIALAVIGISDDIRPMDPAPRLLLQACAAAAIVATLPDGLRALSLLPWWIERVVLFVGILWFVNLVNFMDGIDWMTAAEVVPVTAALALFGLAGVLPSEATLAAAALCGAMLGFAPFNRPVARLFLGDVGSLPIGLLLAWLLIVLAGRGHLTAAMLLPLYYLADATITLLRGLAKGESVTQAHRRHFYQRALDNGFTISGVVARVFVLNLALAGLAAAAVWNSAFALHVTLLATGCVLVGGMLWLFSCARAKR